MKKFNIENIEIGDGCTPLVIPEIGINHNGDLSVAKLMVDSAYRAGARLVKHQTHVIDDEMSSAAKTVKPGNSDKSIYEIMKQSMLSEESEFELKKYVESKGMVYLSTPFSRAAADRLESFGVSAYKIGSGEMNNYPLIKHIAAFGKPMIVSTGMNGIDNIKRTVSILEEYKVPYALMHTTNLYPTLPNMVRLGAMQEMKHIFKNVPIGLSDHTVTNTACISAMALGASIVERHYTDKKSRKGPDIICSMDENELKELLSAAKDIPQMLGGEKGALEEERVTIDFAFATLVSISDIKKGDILSEKNIWVKRPGTGQILAEHYETVLGKRALVDIDNDTQIEWDMIGD